MKDGKELHDDVILHMQERIKNVLTTLNTYRMQHPEEARIEYIMTQLELVADTIENDERLSYRQKMDLDFNLTEGTDLERNGHLNRELYSIRNFAENAL